MSGSPFFFTKITANSLKFYLTKWAAINAIFILISQHDCFFSYCLDRMRYNTDRNCLTKGDCFGPSAFALHIVKHLIILCELDSALKHTFIITKNQ